MGLDSGLSGMFSGSRMRGVTAKLQKELDKIEARPSKRTYRYHERSHRNIEEARSKRSDEAKWWRKHVIRLEAKLGPLQERKVKTGHIYADRDVTYRVFSHEGRDVFAVATSLPSRSALARFWFEEHFKSKRFEEHYKSGDEPIDPDLPQWFVY